MGIHSRLCRGANFFGAGPLLEDSDEEPPSVLQVGIYPHAENPQISTAYNIFIFTYHLSSARASTPFSGGHCPGLIFAFTFSSTSDDMHSSYDSNVRRAARSHAGRHVVRPGRRMSEGSLSETSTRTKSGPAVSAARP